MSAVLASPAFAVDTCTAPTEGAFVCQQLIVVVRTGSSINDVLARSAPDARADYRVADQVPAGHVVTDEDIRTWQVSMPAGQEIADRGSLARDPGVESVTLVHIGQLTPSTAMQPVSNRSGTAFGLLVAAAAMALALKRWRRVAARPR